MHQLYLTCDDLAATVRCAPEEEGPMLPAGGEGVGTVSTITLPSGGTLGLYQMKHPVAAR